MDGEFIQKGNKIKIDIEADPKDISIFGTVDIVDDTMLEVIIDGTYIQNTVRNAKCIVPGNQKIVRFETIILGSKNERLFLALPIEDDVEMFQRRKHMRTSIDMYVDCCFVGFNDKKIDVEQYYSVKLMDISVGGVRLKSKNSIPIGAILVFEMPIDSQSKMFTIKVIRCLESLDRKTYEIGCQFIGLDSSDEKKISSLCIRLQNKKNKS